VLIISGAILSGSLSKDVAGTSIILSSCLINLLIFSYRFLDYKVIRSNISKDKMNNLFNLGLIGIKDNNHNYMRSIKSLKEFDNLNEVQLRAVMKDNKMEIFDDNEITIMKTINLDSLK